MTLRHIDIDRRALIYDIGNCGYIEAHRLESNGGTTEAAHLLSDICAEGNIDRVQRVLDTAYATVAALLPEMRSRRMAGRQCGRYRLLTAAPPTVARLLRETAHEYMVCAVMADWTAIVHPPSSPPWQQKAALAIERVSSAARTAAAVHRRPLSPW